MFFGASLGGDFPDILVLEQLHPSIRKSSLEEKPPRFRTIGLGVTFNGGLKFAKGRRDRFLRISADAKPICTCNRWLSDRYLGTTWKRIPCSECCRRENGLEYDGIAWIRPSPKPDFPAIISKHR